MEPRRQGRVCEWDAQEGCGVVEDGGSGQRIPLPAQAFGGVQRTPAVGDRITYAVELDGQRRPQAAGARFASRRIGRPRRGELWTGSPSAPRRALLLLVVFAAAAAGWWWNAAAG